MSLRSLSKASPTVSTHVALYVGPGQTKPPLLEIDCRHLFPSLATQAQWDDFMSFLHCSGKTLRISRETFQYLLQAHPAARPTGPGRWVRDGEGPIMEFTCQRSEAQWSYAARIYKPV